MEDVPNPTPPAKTPVSARKRARRWLEPAIALALAPFVAIECVRRVGDDTGLASIRDDQVGIVVDGWNRTKTVVDTPGYRPYLPWFQEVHTIDKSPGAFVFRGNRSEGLDQVPRLLIRARDGSSFWFEEVTLQYALRVERAGEVLDDSGGGDAFKEQLLRCHARAMLRDEFGRFAAGESVRPESVAAATRASLERMNAALEAHGIEVLEVSSPKPAFDKGYEDLINRRKLANQETERLRVQIASLQATGELRQQQVRKDKDLELLKLEGNLARDVGKAEGELIRARAEADNVVAERVSQGRIAKAEKELQAAVLSAKYRGLAEDAQARAEALRVHGAGAVRAALVDQLGGIQIQIVPYSRDPAPQRIEYEQPAAKP
ncbi:MAG: SPFH domain-containing protein [Planctomycetota bacterium]|nr:SPFH domain-containing protein [Planctomycetota bacterium]